MGNPRLVHQPVFLLSTVRSGSTLLRCLLNSHPDVHAPSELHLRHVRVVLDDEFGEIGMEALGYGVEDLEHLLWDRLLHRLLTASGKRIIVDKSPSNVVMWRRLRQCWPDARFILLRRNPAAIVASIVAANDGRDAATAIKEVRSAMACLDDAGAALPDCVTVAYEDLTQEPAGTCARLCRFLGVRWEPGMLAYGSHDHGTFRYGIGDWSANIRSGRVQPARSAPSPTSPELAALCQQWGYRSAPTP